MFGAQWEAIGRESALCCNLVGIGVTNLGRADYTNLGNYYTAFFGLTVGLERMAKLVLVADYAIGNKSMPSPSYLKNYGHELAKLFKKCRDLIKKHGITLTYPYPNNQICDKIIKCLDNFAAASKGRYANFTELSNPTLCREEPFRQWWNEVAELILKKHFYNTSKEKVVKDFAKVSGQAMTPAIVCLSTEDGTKLSDIESAVYRKKQTETIQRYGRFYTLNIVRWLAEFLCNIAKIAANEHQIKAFFGLEEHYQGNYILPDTFLKQRKIWPILKNY